MGSWAYAALCLPRERPALNKTRSLILIKLLKVTGKFKFRLASQLASGAGALQGLQGSAGLCSLSRLSLQPALQPDGLRPRLRRDCD